MKHVWVREDDVSRLLDGVSGLLRSVPIVHGDVHAPGEPALDFAEAERENRVVMSETRESASQICRSRALSRAKKKKGDNMPKAQVKTSKVATAPSRLEPVCA